MKDEDETNPYGCRHLDPNDELFGVTAEMAGYERADCPKDCPDHKECWGVIGIVMGAEVGSQSKKPLGIWC